ncbi:hypothetical protein HDU89_006153 [Geranomyces variabilis]|nr:hypothetical protein HDU89_006153 [Geranomyces variabilis]
MQTSRPGFAEQLFRSISVSGLPFSEYTSRSGAHSLTAGDIWHSTKSRLGEEGMIELLYCLCLIYFEERKDDFTGALDTFMEDPESPQYKFLTDLLRDPQKFAGFSRDLGIIRPKYENLDYFLLNWKRGSEVAPRAEIRKRALHEKVPADRDSARKAWWAVEMLVMVKGRPWLFWKTFILAGFLQKEISISKEDSKEAEPMWINIERSLAIWQIAAAKGDNRET